MSIRVSALVSVYNAERFMRAALEDLVAQTLFAHGELEIIVINSGSPQGEETIVKEFQNRHANIKYVRTERETIYAAWNRGLRLASGTYLTNANTDDRHRPDGLELLANALERSGSGVAYADALITRGENETLGTNAADRVFRWPRFSLRQLLMHSVFGPQPMWRRSLHDEIGLFDPKYTVAGDYEFFIRAAWRQGAVHVPEILGLYFEGGTESRNLEKCKNETEEVLRRYRWSIPIEDIYPRCRELDNPQAARAVALLDFARCLATGPHPDAALTRRLRDEAALILLRSTPRAWASLSLRWLAARRKNAAAVRDTGRWHPVLADLPPIASEIVKPLS
ncbi:MAG: glycosyltransferase [Deltaproteobacteria bacterium]|nr:glycosyltransferase [Deltaproteobacteria bacterium]